MEISHISYDQIPILEKALDVQRALLLSNVGDERTEETGFLLNETSIADLQDALKGESDLIVATEDATVAAYLLVASGHSYLERHEGTRAEWISEDYRSEYESGDFCYLDQLGVDRRFERRGLATQLIAYVCGLRPPGEVLMAAILSKPVPNLASHALFEKEGFQKIGELVTGELGGLADVRSSLMARRSPCG